MAPDTAQEAARLRTEWRAALALVRRDEPDTTRAEQQAFDALVGYVEANGLQHSEFDPRRRSEG